MMKQPRLYLTVINKRLTKLNDDVILISLGYVSILFKSGHPKFS